ncbi:hypothetical protein C5B85_10890 [Pseudoclavibacter sp. AY1F1]|uniref:hypothetical protein n=1 Tax=Pseudoclavibacter sp. AY1F1 TaxID=2080583 RepID=UPI000CE8968E|nr:hypothetical protein [Pseudoclavibacter sp. AY1F1]PPF44144.1 hypothetical protein C5B85_10890 [Pseudoclavibacter sp. AY1F1]
MIAFVAPLVLLFSLPLGTTMGEGIAAVAASVTLITALAIAVKADEISRAQLDYQIRDAARLGLTDLTTGETAEARDIIGSLIYNTLARQTASRADVIRSYFRLMWAIERAGAVVESLRGHKDVQKEAVSAWAWHLDEIAFNVWLIGTTEQADRHLGLDDLDARRRASGVIQALSSVRTESAGDNWSIVSSEANWTDEAAAKHALLRWQEEQRERHPASKALRLGSRMRVLV